MDRPKHFYFGILLVIVGILLISPIFRPDPQIDVGGAVFFNLGGLITIIAGIHLALSRQENHRCREDNITRTDEELQTSKPNVATERDAPAKESTKTLNAEKTPLKNVLRYSSVPRPKYKDNPVYKEPIGIVRLSNGLSIDLDLMYFTEYFGGQWIVHIHHDQDLALDQDKYREFLNLCKAGNRSRHMISLASGVLICAKHLVMAQRSGEMLRCAVAKKQNYDPKLPNLCFIGGYKDSRLVLNLSCAEWGAFVVNMRRLSDYQFFKLPEEEKYLNISTIGCGSLYVQRVGESYRLIRTLCYRLPSMIFDRDGKLSLGGIGMADVNEREFQEILLASKVDIHWSMPNCISWSYKGKQYGVEIHWQTSLFDIAQAYLREKNGSFWLVDQYESQTFDLIGKYLPKRDRLNFEYDRKDIENEFWGVSWMAPEYRYDRRYYEVEDKDFQEAKIIFGEGRIVTIELLHTLHADGVESFVAKIVNRVECEFNVKMVTDALLLGRRDAVLQRRATADLSPNVYAQVLTKEASMGKIEVMLRVVNMYRECT